MARSVRRFDQRTGFLVSLTFHLTVLMLLFLYKPPKHQDDEIDPKLLEHKQVVFMPPAATLKKLLPPELRRPAPAPVPIPAPTPPTGKKDRISIGAPSDVRQKELILRREDDLTKTAKGQNVPPTPAPATPPPTPAPVQTAQKAGVEGKAGREGLKLPPGLLGQTPAGDEGRKPFVGPMAPQIADAVNGVSQRVLRDARAGIPTGTSERGMGPLSFDPQGADFTLWVNEFKNEVYRNWTIPNNALFGASRGHVDFEFVIERDGRMSSIRMEKSSGTPSLDKAAEFAMTSSRFLPLPDDYGPPRVTMHVSFHYNDVQGS